RPGELHTTPQVPGHAAVRYRPGAEAVECARFLERLPLALGARDEVQRGPVAVARGAQGQLLRLDLGVHRRQVGAGAQRLVDEWADVDAFARLRRERLVRDVEVGVAGGSHRLVE